ncbi:Hpt domain-containing protein [Oxalobacteraceae bacterium A2-2]
MTASSDSAPLDMAEGLERLMGDHALYLQMLRRFRKTYLDCAPRLRQLVADGDWDGAARLAHTLQGAAGMIAAHRVFDLATMVEAACANQMAPFVLGQLEQALALLMPAIDTLVERPASLEPSVSPGTPTATAQPGRKLLVQLACLLEEGDGAAIDVLEESGGELAASLGKATYEDVAAAVHRFDFEGALEILSARL